MIAKAPGMREPNAAIATAIATAAQLTGVSARYLTATAARESSFDAAAQAGTSSAAGLYQFIESTWLSTLSRHAESLGLEREAQLSRDDALALRFDPRLSALLAGALTADNAHVLETRLGRTPTDGELYAAHVLGAGGAAQLARAVRANPDASAADLFPDAARANHALFHDASDRAVTVAELTKKFDGMMGEAAPAPVSPAVVADAVPTVAAPNVEAARPPQSADFRTITLRGMRAPLRLDPDTVEILASLKAPDRKDRSDEDA